MHFVQESATAFLACFLFGATHIDQIAGVRQDMLRRITIFLAPIFECLYGALLQRLRIPLTLITRKECKSASAQLVCIGYGVLYASGGTYMRSDKLLLLIHFVLYFNRSINPFGT